MHLFTDNLNILQLTYYTNCTNCTVQLVASLYTIRFALDFYFTHQCCTAYCFCQSLLMHTHNAHMHVHLHTHMHSHTTHIYTHNYVTSFAKMANLLPSWPSGHLFAGPILAGKADSQQGITTPDWLVRLYGHGQGHEGFSYIL